LNDKVRKKKKEKKKRGKRSRPKRRLRGAMRRSKLRQPEGGIAEGAGKSARGKEGGGGGKKKAFWQLGSQRLAAFPYQGLKKGSVRFKAEEKGKREKEMIG